MNTEKEFTIENIVATSNYLLKLQREREKQNGFDLFCFVCFKGLQLLLAIAEDRFEEQQLLYAIGQGVL